MGSHVRMRMRAWHRDKPVRREQTTQKLTCTATNLAPAEARGTGQHMPTSLPTQQRAATLEQQELLDLWGVNQQQPSTQAACNSRQPKQLAEDAYNVSWPVALALATCTP